MRVYWFGLLFILLPKLLIAQSVIINSVTDTTFCANTAIYAELTVDTLFAPDNEFLLELSDTSGNFTGNEIVLAQIASDSISSIEGQIPSETIASSSYRVRIRSSNPVIINTYEKKLHISNPSISISYVGNISCYGQSSGSFEVEAHDGKPPYQFSIDNGNSWQSSGLFENLIAQEYQVLLSDQISCTAYETIQIMQPSDTLSAIVSIQDVTCFGGQTGAVELIGSGGVPPYNYILGGSQPEQDNGIFTDLFAGTYTYVIKDANDCQLSGELVVGEPKQLIIEFSVTDVSCNDDLGSRNDGAINISVTGGAGGYSYYWTTDDGTGIVENEQDQAGLGKGTYNLTVIDTNSCRSDISVSVDEPPKLSLLIDKKDITCNDDSGISNDGNIDLTVSGGSGFYSIQWNTGAESEDLLNLGPGEYIVTVTEPAGCSASETVFITQPEKLQVSEIHGNVSCSGSGNNANDGFIDISVSGGSGTYSYIWDNGESTEDLNNLESGIYNLTVMDSLGCNSSIAVIILAPEVISISANVSDVTCNDDAGSSSDGIIDLTITGGTPPFSFLWDIGKMSEDLDSLPAGTYSVEITDNLGCAAISVFTVNEPGKLNITETHGTPSCFDDNGLSSDGFIDVTVTGGSGSYTYMWDNDSTTQDLHGLTSGLYTLRVADSLGCSALLTVELDSPQQLLISSTQKDVSCFNDSGPSNDGAIDISAKGGTGDLIYNWNTQDTVPDISNLAAGNYILTVFDSNNCRSTHEVIIQQPEQLQMELAVPAPVCSPNTIDLSDLITANFNGTDDFYTNSDLTALANNPLAIDTTGTYYIRRVDDMDCQLVRSVDIIINQSPELYTKSVNLICSDSLIDLSQQVWDAKNVPGTFSYWYDAQEESAIGDYQNIRDSGIYYIKKTTSESCEDIDSVDVNITISPLLTVTDPPGICSPGTVDISNLYFDLQQTTGEISYWADPELTQSVGDPESIGQSNTYYIEKVTSDGCSAVAEVKVVINKKPRLLVQNPPTICEGQNINLANYWSLETQLPGEISYYLDSELTLQVDDPFQIGAAGQYYLSFITNSGCIDSDSLLLSIGKYPELVISDPPPICQGDTINLNSWVEDRTHFEGQIQFWEDSSMKNEIPGGLVGRSGTFFVSKESDQGCMTQETIATIVNNVPELTVNGKTETCSPGTINLENLIKDLNSTTGNLSFWRDKGFITPIENAKIMTESGTFYILKNTVFGNCTDTLAVTLKFIETPSTPTIAFDTDTLWSSAKAGNQWFDLEGPIPSANDQYYVPEQEGFYTVCYWEEGCESKPAEYFYFKPLGLININETAYVSTYPNPAHHTLTIGIEKLRGWVDVTIFDKHTQLVYNGRHFIEDESATVELSVDQYNKGLYLLIVSGEEEVLTSKIILE